MIAILCLFLKRMRGLATFSLFHILLSAKIILSSERTNSYTVFDIRYVHWCWELIPARFIQTICIIADEEAASAPCDGREHRTCQKDHYDLRRVKTRTKLTEILYIFFDIYTTNVVQLADRIEQRAQLAASWNENMHIEMFFTGEQRRCHRELTNNPAETTGMG